MSTHPHLPASGTPLAGRYLLLDQIGSGGMGSVWRAFDLRTRTFVAAKVLGQHDGGMLLRFVREQSVRIQHPHVVAPSGWAAEDNLVVFTMDLVRGGSVQTLLGDHGPLPEPYVMVVLDQLLQALDAVHTAGVVHRDIKPANLMLEPTGTGRPHLRLGDFGVAALIEEVRLTRFPGAIGTDGYMAPEQVHGAPPEPRQDLYAAGVVAVQMLTGHAPRQQDGVPEGVLAPLLESMTSPDAERRPPTAAAALAYLRRLGVPPGAPWQADPEAPEVFDQLGEAPLPDQLPDASPFTGQAGTPSNPGPPVDAFPVEAPAHPVQPYAAPPFPAGPSPSREPTRQAGPRDPYAYAPGPQGQPGQPGQHGQHAPATGGGAYTTAAIACFALALLCCLVALYLML